MFLLFLSSTKSWVFELVWLCLSSLPNFLYLAEVLEHACGMAGLQVGEFASNIPNGIDTYSIREPLGVCSGICSFNFPAMIPLWVSLLCFSFFSSFDFYSSKKKVILSFSLIFSLHVLFGDCSFWLTENI